MSCCLLHVQVCNELGCLILVVICNTLVIFGLKLTKPHLLIPWLGVYLLGEHGQTLSRSLMTCVFGSGMSSEPYKSVVLCDKFWILYAKSLSRATALVYG